MSLKNILNPGIVTKQSLGLGNVPAGAPSTWRVGIANNLVYQHTNELNLKDTPAVSDSSHKLWFNYRDGDTDKVNASNLLTDYFFGNRNGVTTGVTLHADSFSGSAAYAKNGPDASTSAHGWMTAADYDTLHSTAGNDAEGDEFSVYRSGNALRVKVKAGGTLDLDSDNYLTKEGSRVSSLKINGLVYSTSDARYKFDIEDYNESKIADVRIVKYRFKDIPDTLRVGVIAQELEDAGFGDFVEEGDPKSVDHHSVIYAMIQDLRNEVVKLKQKLNEYESQS